MNIPVANPRGYRILQYDDIDNRSDDDTDIEREIPDHDDDERLTHDDRVSTSGRGRRRRGIPANTSFSGTPTWPQSYRASMDAQQIFSASSSSFSLFSPIARVSSSYISTSHKKPGFFPGSSDDLQKLLLPAAKKKEDGQQQPISGKAPEQKDEPELDHAYIPSNVVDLDKLRAEHGSSFFQASLNGLNVLAGVGVLSTPYALKEGGYLGLSLLFVLAIICCYTGILLRRCLDSRPGAVTYPDIGEAAFGSAGRMVISIILYVELYACCVEFLILEGDNLAALFPGVTFDLGGIHLDPVPLFSFIAALIILPTVWLRDLSLLSYLSAGGVIATAFVVFSVVWVGSVDGVGFSHVRGSLLNLAGLPVSIGLYGFCYSGHAVFPNIYMSMRKPADFDKVLYFSFFVVSLIYGGVAIMGYMMFGGDIQSSITLNLPKEFIASKIAVWTTVINPITKFALTMMPVALCLEELLPGDPDSFKGRSSSLAIRTVLVASTILVATMVPFFGLVMAFIGAFMSMSVSVIFPCACYLSIMGHEVTTAQRIACGLIIFLGVLCAIAGTYSSAAAIVESFFDT